MHVWSRRCQWYHHLKWWDERRSSQHFTNTLPTHTQRLQACPPLQCTTWGRKNFGCTLAWPTTQIKLNLDIYPYNFSKFVWADVSRCLKKLQRLSPCVPLTFCFLLDKFLYNFLFWRGESICTDIGESLINNLCTASNTLKEIPFVIIHSNCVWLVEGLCRFL